ncbi:pyridoxamine 5'-phosphate oxidase family protein [Mycobacterium cookii]|uniref:Pyridoxamine 5'-phosphate oxidase n=1 Tax=Mycobacterium cookii TaxID=1775 RepID=A0A7I7KVN5_9MYCO|nr:pyridoxamine 5'-phosphate oxidase family protein [Mycobacterium cookii]BBX45884.1 pyridoxamine 5'-phosphate oxidase [Mycobacterium cookii]
MMLQELDLLNRAEWMKLVRTASVGRLVFTAQALPAVHLVDFRWWRGDVVIRITDPAVLAATSRNRIVAFEADELDMDLQRGWSVTVVGHAQVITEVPDLMELSTLFSRPSVGGRCDYFVRIKTEKVTGRQLGRNQQSDSTFSATQFGDDQLDGTR